MWKFAVVGITDKIRNTIRDKVHTIFDRQINWLLRKKNFSEEDSIVIFAQPRSGSTWLMNILSRIPRTCVNWEPLHVERGVVPDDFDFDWQPYVPQNERSEEYKEFFNDVHTFAVSNQWTRKYLKLTDLVKGKYVVTKYVRANMLIPYILKNQNLKIPPIFLLRHPIDTCISQIDAFGISENDTDLNTDLEIYFKNDYERVKNFIETRTSPLEVKVARWCVINTPTIRNLELVNDLVVVFYSDLILDPEKEVVRILKELHVDFDYRKVVESMDFTEASETDFNNNFISEPEEQLFKNIKNLEDDMKARIQEIFDFFDFKLYNAYSPYPEKEVLAIRSKQE